jgi:hypothetical protein
MGFLGKVGSFIGSALSKFGQIGGQAIDKVAQLGVPIYLFPGLILVDPLHNVISSLLLQSR